jgi:hypothetical protein
VNVAPGQRRQFRPPQPRAKRRQVQWPAILAAGRNQVPHFVIRERPPLPDLPAFDAHLADVLKRVCHDRALPFQPVEQNADGVQVVVESLGGLVLAGAPPQERLRRNVGNPRPTALFEQPQAPPPHRVDVSVIPAPRFQIGDERVKVRFQRARRGFPLRLWRQDARGFPFQVAHQVTQPRFCCLPVACSQGYVADARFTGQTNLCPPHSPTRFLELVRDHCPFPPFLCPSMYATKSPSVTRVNRPTFTVRRSPPATRRQNARSETRNASAAS